MIVSPNAGVVGNSILSKHKPTIGAFKSRYLTQFDDVANSYVAIPALTLPPSQDFEIELQVYHAATPDSNKFLLGGDAGGGAENFVIYLDNTGEVNAQLPTQTTSSYPGQTITTNKLNTVSVAKTGNIYQVSVNGSAGVAIDVSAKGAADITLRNISAWGANRNFDGIIADVKVWTGGNKATGTLAREYRLDESPVATTAIDRASGQHGTRYNIAVDDVEKFSFDKINNRWVNTDSSKILEL